jgi:acyl-[acyl-carrier-protein]-phospholipid O-acyltransferase/long-chain-fatty-acid--[acyl-carrier-protein] ligase
MVKDNIGGNEDVVTLGLTTFVVGIAAGSGFAARASHGTPNLALVPLGAAMMGFFGLAIALVAGLMDPAGQNLGPLGVLASGAGLALLVALLGLAVAGGLFIVPAFAAVQAWAPPEARARVIASVNVMNAAYMVAGGAVVAVLQALGVGVPLLFAGLGILSLAAVLYVLRAWEAEGVRSPAFKA